MSSDLIAAIVRLRRSLSRAAAAALSSSGVGPRQFSVMRELRQAGPLSQVELARSTATDPAGLMRAVDALASRGWVLRSSSLEDRRCKIVSLTPRGQEALRALDGAYGPLVALAQSSLTSAERKQFAALAEKLTAAFEAAGRDDVPSAPSPARPRAATQRTEHR